VNFLDYNSIKTKSNFVIYGGKDVTGTYFSVSTSVLPVLTIILLNFHAYLILSSPGIGTVGPI
jgi:hypothetical protein